MSKSDDEKAKGALVDRIKHNDFFYSKSWQYKIVELNFYERQHVKEFHTIDLLKFGCNKTKLDDKLKTYYECEHGRYIPCDISIKEYRCLYTEGTSLKKKHLSTNYVNWIVWYDLESVCYNHELNGEKNKKLNFHVDSIVINIDCDHKLPLNRITHLMIRFDRVRKVDYRGKRRYHVNAYICQGNIMLAA